MAPGQVLKCVASPKRVMSDKLDGRRGRVNTSDADFFGHYSATWLDSPVGNSGAIGHAGLGDDPIPLQITHFPPDNNVEHSAAGSFPLPETATAGAAGHCEAANTPRRGVRRDASIGHAGRRPRRLGCRRSTGMATTAPTELAVLMGHRGARRIQWASLLRPGRLSGGRVGFAAAVCPTAHADGGPVGPLAQRSGRSEVTDIEPWRRATGPTSVRAPGPLAGQPGGDTGRPLFPALDHER